MPKQAEKAKASKLRKNARKMLPASKLRVSPPRKQQRLGGKSVNRVARQSEHTTSGPSILGSQISSSHTVAEPSASQVDASQIPSSSQLNSSFTDRLEDADVAALCWFMHT